MGGKTFKSSTKIGLTKNKIMFGSLVVGELEVNLII